MSYTKQGFKDGNCLCAAELEKMEDGILEAVTHTAQTLTEAQKAQARENIGITGTGADGEDGEDGVGIASIVQTSTSSADGGSNVITITLTDGNEVTFTVKNGSKGSMGAAGSNGADGEDGVGIASAVLNSDYTLTLLFDNGTSYTTPSIRGADGESVSVESTSESSADGGNNYVYFSDGSVLVVRNGSKGSAGADGVGISSVSQYATSTADGGANVLRVYLDNGTYTNFTVRNGSKGSTGADGYTPVKGTDYWTDADKEEIKAYVDEAILGGAW